MAIGIISDEAFEAEQTRFIEIKRGRGESKEVPNEIRALAAQELIAGARAKDVAEQFNLSPAALSAYKNDATSTASYNKPNEDLRDRNNAFRDTIKTLAADRLMAALESITPDKLHSAKLQTASAVARDMSGIIKNVSPELQDQVNNQVIIYKPRMKDEEDYEAIDAQVIEVD